MARNEANHPERSDRSRSSRPARLPAGAGGRPVPTLPEARSLSFTLWGFQLSAGGIFPGTLRVVMHLSRKLPHSLVAVVGLTGAQPDTMHAK